MPPSDTPHPWTIGLSFIAILISVASLWQSCSTANVTKSIARPLVYSTKACFTKGPTAEDVPIVGVTLKNFGQLPAQKIESRFDVEFLPKDEKLKWNLDKKTSDSNKEEILGSQDETFINHEKSPPLTARDIQDLMQGSKTLFYYGEATYQTGNGNPALMKWCWKYKPVVKEFWRCDGEDLADPRPR